MFSVTCSDIDEKTVREFNKELAVAVSKLSVREKIRLFDPRDDLSDLPARNNVVVARRLLDCYVDARALISS